MTNDIELAIIVPTRNRPDFLPVGIDSILGQLTDLPIRVIVSDNSDDADAELNSTRIISINRPNFSYIRPPKTLAMVDHWNWAVEHVLNKRPCTHLTILTDRGFYRRGALHDLIGIIRGYDKDVISFLGDTILDFYSPIVIGENNWTGNVDILKSCTLLSNASYCKFDKALPKVLNSVVPFSVARELKERSGYVFPPTLSPDYGIAFELLIARERVIFFDKPLTVGFGLHSSNGANMGVGLHGNQTVRDFVKLNKKSGREIILRVPIPEIFNSANAIVHEYLCARDQHPSENLPKVSFHAYLEFMYRSLDSIDDRNLKLKYRALLLKHGFREKRRDLLSKMFHKLKGKFEKGNVRSFASTTDAITYAYENYPSQSTKLG